MSRPRFLADHDLNARIVDGLLRREPSVELFRLRELLPMNTADEDVLGYAASTDLVVLTHDVNTMTAAAKAMIGDGRTFNGMVVVPQSLGVGEAIDDLLLLWSVGAEADWQNRILFLPF
jgi:hypothetical protein